MLKKVLCFLAVLVILSSLAAKSHANTNLSSYSVFATNSVWVRQNATVNSGNIGVEAASPGPWLDSQSEVTIGKSAYVADGISIYGDSVYIKTGASVFDVHYNALTNNGSIRANEHTPLSLPLSVTLPDFPTPAPGTENHDVPQGGTLTLDPGSYGEIMVRQNAILILTGGTYHFENLDLADTTGSRVLFQAPTDLIINNRLEPGQNAVIGPDVGSGISAKDIRIFVNGINGSTGNLGATPKAAQIGYDNTLQANIYAPNGTLLIKQGTVAEGAFIAKDVQVGLSVQVTLNSGFGAYPEPTVTFSATPEAIKVGESATLSWDSTEAESASIDHGVGAVAVSGSTTVSPAVTTTYTITVIGPGGTATAQATVFVEDSFTFTQSVNELDNQSLTFTPDGSPNFYHACLEAATAFPTDPTGGTSISLGDDDYEMVTLTGGAQVSLYGVSYSYLYVGSNGYLTFTSGDTDYSESFADHFDTPRISALFNDLRPSASTTVSWKQLADRLVVTYEGIPEYGTSNSNNFQIEMFFDGTIRITYLGIDASDGIAGLSAGGGIPAGFVESDVNAYGGCLSLLAGDFDGDGDVDASDQAIFDADFGRTDCAQGDPCEGDFDGDGDVDDADRAVFEANFGRTDGARTVPNVVGLEQALAESTITSVGLTVGTITTDYSDTVPAGQVISQSPGAGTYAEQGSTVSLLVSIGVAPPTVSMSANPAYIEAGQSATLSWTSTRADSAFIDQGVGTVDASGSVAVSPTTTTTYTITVTGPGGTATDNATVNITSPPTVSISATPQTIMEGDSATLSWTSTYASSVSIDQGIGSVAPEGSLTVTPGVTTTYTITATGPLGTATDQAHITVQIVVAPQPEASFGQQYEDLIPPDTAVSSYDPVRFSVVTGLVQDIDGLPIAGVSATILEYPEYGTTLTDAEGRFSLPVEGGATITVNYHKEGLLTAQRKVYVPWNDTAVTETLRMVTVDSAATTVTFDGNPGTVFTHQSTEVVDESGSRSATVVFTGDTAAYEVSASGSVIRQLNGITTRATEYPTPESMPAILPPTSAFTYCVELSVDGVERVKFDKPVITWVDNFLGFDVGMVAPVGSYDRDRGVWVPEENGLVVKLLDTDSDGISDALDADGDDQPDDLNNNGSFADEVTGLEDAQKYPPGATYWRVSFNHFSPKDINWAGRIIASLTPLIPQGPEGSIRPNPTSEPLVDEQTDEGDTCPNYTSSFVDGRSRIFHEDIAIPGTDFTLHYASNRVEGYRHGITVPASGDTVPEGLRRIIVKVEVAGRTFEQVLDPLPNQKAEFVWDGLDYLGRKVIGSANADVQIGFVYDAVYTVPPELERAFAAVGRDLTSIMTRDEVTLWKRSNLLISATKIKGMGILAEGWTLSPHHSLNPINPTSLYKGDGAVNKNMTSFLIINTVAGGEDYGYTGDGGPATEALLFQPSSVALDAAGNLYISDTLNHRIRKVDTSGTIRTLAGYGATGTGGGGYNGDNSALYTKLNRPAGIAVDGTGNVYFADRYNHRIRKVITSGSPRVVTLAGSGVPGPGGYGGDGGLATQALLSWPEDVAVDAEGNLFIADTGNLRIRKVDTNGIITTVAGNGEIGPGGDGGPATEASLDWLRAVAVDATGNIYIVDRNRLRMVDTSGIITTIATFGNPSDVAVDSSGNIIIANGNVLQRTDVTGNIITVAGGSIYGPSGDGEIATVAGLYSAIGVALDANDNIYIVEYSSQSGRHRVRRVAPFKTFADVVTAADITFAEESGVGHVLSSSGRHQTTIDLDTGVVLLGFGYDEENNLVSITDRHGNQTLVQSDGGGVPTAIISPDGLATTLSIDSNNHLTQVTYPDSGYYTFEYTPDGLLTAKVEPEGNRFEHVFNSLGRLTDATDQNGGHWQYARYAYENGDILTEVATGEGNLTSYLDRTDSTGAYTSTITDPTGAQTVFFRSADGLTVNKSLPCGMDLQFTYDLDSQYNFSYVTESRESTPSALEKVTLIERGYQDTNSDDVPDLITETVTVNSKVTTLVTDTLQATETITSPEGRGVTTMYDPNTLLTTNLIIPGLYDTAYGYDIKGRLASIATNTRQTTFAYDAQGNLSSITDPENQTISYSYDAVGRMTGISRPDTNSVAFTYDKNGNMTVLTNPANIDHGFGYNLVNLNSSYTTPLSGSYSYVYDKDRRLVQVNFPSGKQINNLYGNGRLEQIQTPEGNVYLTYLCGSKVDTITKGSEDISYGYDGSLVTSENFSGTLNEPLSYGYNSDFNLTSFTYAGGTVGYTHDSDGLLTGSGTFTVSRNAGNGLPESVSGGALNLSRTFNGYGEVAGQDFTVGSQGVTSWGLTRDNAGRITTKTETVNGVTSSNDYTYDPMGRLLTVTKDGNLVEEYQYDSVGTRIYEMNAERAITGRTFTYDDEDHLLTVGDASYQYDLDGYLTTKTVGTEPPYEVTTYSYSSRGELLSVTLPDGTLIEYVHDPLGRRIAKKVNGVITKKYLWQGLTRLLAVYDGNDFLLTRFLYADGRMPVAMEQGGVTYYLTYDQVGSLRVVADAVGNVVEKVEYDSFGNIINDMNPSFEIPFGFAGGLQDRDTGLVRFGFRDYEPDVGRWTAKDPIGFNGGDIDLYGYCLADPINWVDPLGLDATLIIDRATGLLTGGDDEGNTTVTRIKENGISTTPGDPYGTNGPIPLGTYNINPRPSNLNHPGRPTISSPGQGWNTIVTPRGTVRHGVQIHEEVPGVRSRGCPLTPPGTSNYNDLLDLINDEYGDGGVRLQVIDSSFWSRG